MVVIDHNDLDKTKEEILLDLIFEATRQRFPIDKIVFGEPREVLTRPNDPLYPNTHIPVNVNIGFDVRYALPESGFMYRRRDISEHLKDVDWSQVLVPPFPMQVIDLLEQINTQLEYPVKACEVDNFTYDSIEQMQHYGFIVKAAASSLLWCNSVTSFDVNYGNLGPEEPMVTVTRLPGFMKMTA